MAAQHAAGDTGGTTPTVLPGAGINEGNAAALVAATGVAELHGSFRSPHSCATVYKKLGVFMGKSSCTVHSHYINEEEGRKRRVCVRACVYVCRGVVQRNDLQNLIPIETFETSMQVPFFNPGL